MPAFELKGLENLDEAIQIEHREWLRNSRLQDSSSNLIDEKNIGLEKSLINSIKDDEHLARFSLLKFPKLWSGNRAGETSIKSDPNVIPIDFLGVISRQKQKCRAKYWDQEVARWEKLEEDYKKFLEYLKERFLARAIKITLKSVLDAIPVANNQARIELKEFYKSAERSPVNLQTQDQCVAEHAKITQAIQKARNGIGAENKKDELTKLKQLEILSKRRVDMHYENATKKTTADVVTSGISAASSTIGMVTAFAAAALWIGGFFFPPLWVGAAILGTISFVSYASTTINVGKVIRNGINGRPPSRSEVKDLAIEAALAPLNVIGKFFIGFRHFVKSSTAVKSILKKTAAVSTNLVSNVVPDAPFVKDNIGEAKDAVSDARKHGKSENDLSLTSSTKVLSMLSKKLPFTQAQALVAELDTSLETSSSILVHLRKEKAHETSELKLTTQPSEHANISDWSFGFRMSIKYKSELQPIQAALDQYKTLPVNATYEERRLLLQNISFECQRKIPDKDTNSGPSEKIRELKFIVDAELKNLKTIAQNEDLATSRPLVVNR